MACWFFPRWNDDTVINLKNLRFPLIDKEFIKFIFRCHGIKLFLSNYRSQLGSKGSSVPARKKRNFTFEKIIDKGTKDTRETSFGPTRKIKATGSFQRSSLERAETHRSETLMTQSEAVQEFKSNLLCWLVSLILPVDIPSFWCQPSECVVFSWSILILKILLISCFSVFCSTRWMFF